MDKKKIDPYKTLGVEKDADQKKIKKAYIKKAKKFHPDQNPDAPPDKIQEINQAYEILANPIKREKFDNGQDFEDTTDANHAINQIIILTFEGTLAEIVKHNRYKQVDMIRIMSDTLGNLIEKMKVSINQARLQKMSLIEIKERLSAKDNENFLLRVIENKINFVEASIRNTQTDIENHSTAKTRIQLYNYKFEEPKSVSMNINMADLASEFSKFRWS